MVKINYTVHKLMVIYQVDGYPPIGQLGLCKEVKLKIVLTFQMGLEMWTMEEKYLMTILRMHHQLVS